MKNLSILFSLFTTLVVYNAALCQPIKIQLTTTERLTQSLSQSLLPITTTIHGSTGKDITFSFFDLCYCGSTTDSTAKFITVAKTGQPDIVRQKPLINKSLCNDKTALINNIINNPAAPDSTALGFIDVTWNKGILSFRMTDINILSKIQNSTFDDNFMKQIKESEKLNYDIQTSELKIKASDQKVIPIHVRPFFSQSNIAFTIAPSELFKINELEKPSDPEQFIENSNAVLNIDYGF